ncbi:uncharacterized protein NPIL_493271 [Nephila pilipes]|uniref:Peptidase aspartic putative domain-containing protein n=1 Tax=Nephila pilipes TaxID=299642 RepID=A0A8X6UK35_NEPPI|nr:uncharacterized protein NPIL_493271 [Nephila pilipes]
MHDDDNIDSDTDESYIILDYNETKGGENVVGKLGATSTIARRTLRWPKAIFYSFLNIAGINSRIMLHMSSPEEKIAIIKKNGLCRVCLAKGHLASRCRSQITCQLCSKRHLKFMCPNIVCNKSDSPKQEVNDKNINEKTIDSLHSRATNKVILQTLVVNVHVIKKERKARAIIDTGSQKSYILKSTAEDLGFNLQREEEFRHSLFGGTKTKMYKHKCYKIYLSSLDGNYICKLDALDHDVICNDISSVKNGSWIHELKTKNILLTDIQENTGPIEVFLGADVAVQKECYSNEETRKNLRGLLVFEDEEGILRLKSRLINEEESKCFISPIILPSKDLADIPLNNVSDLDQIEKTNIVLRWRYIQKVRENLKQRFKREYLGLLCSSVTKREDKINLGKEGIIRLVKLRTEKGNVLRPIQRLYPLELKANYEQVVSENWKGPEVVTEYPELNTDSNKTVPVTSSGREIKPVKRMDL